VALIREGQAHISLDTALLGQTELLALHARLPESALNTCLHWWHTPPWCSSPLAHQRSRTTTTRAAQDRSDCADCHINDGIGGESAEATVYCMVRGSQCCQVSNL
jgi:hypothetical protein